MTIAIVSTDMFQLKTRYYMLCRKLLLSEASFVGSFFGNVGSFFCRKLLWKCRKLLVGSFFGYGYGYGYGYIRSFLSEASLGLSEASFSTDRET